MLWLRSSAPEEPLLGSVRAGPNPFRIAIDPNGNLTSKSGGSDTWVYEWNARNELTRVTKNGVEQARFAYDPLGRRVEKVAGGVTTNHTYDRSAIQRAVQGNTTLKYVHGPGIDEPLAADDGSTMTYFSADGLGSVTKTTDGVGTVVLLRQYDAWGALQAGADQAGYAFTGREWEPEAGLYYYRARYYDPKMARFIGEDPIGFRSGDVNFYSYAANNPTALVDPFGLFTEDTIPPGKNLCRKYGNCPPEPPREPADWSWVTEDHSELECILKCMVLGFADDVGEGAFSLVSKRARKWLTTPTGKGAGTSAGIAGCQIAFAYCTGRCGKKYGRPDPPFTPCGNWGCK